MKVFISWSGARSKRVAVALRGLVADFVVGAEPWVSARDIASGCAWQAEVGEQLDKADWGVLCITPENYSAPWVNYETGWLAGALFRKGCRGVCPYLTDLSVDVLPAGHPLRQFQCRAATLLDTGELLHDLSGGAALHRTQIAGLRGLLSERWPTFQEEVSPRIVDIMDDTTMFEIEAIGAAMLAGQSASLAHAIRMALVFARVERDSAAERELLQLLKTVSLLPMNDLPPVVATRVHALFSALHAKVLPKLAIFQNSAIGGALGPLPCPQ